MNEATTGSGVTGAQNIPTARSGWTSDTALLIYIAAATVVVHMATGNRYGFHRDELATLDDARHLAWGYVAYPPVTPFFGRLALVLFGTSLRGFRFFAAIAQAIGVVLTGLMARELGGRRGAQLIAAVAIVPIALAAGAVMQYVSFDYLCWVFTAYSILRLLRSENPRWWIAVGIGVGCGMMSKYSMMFLVASILGGLILTDARRYLANKWLWYGVGVSLLIFLPNAVWQIRHHFISLDFLKHIHERDIRIGRTKDFLPDQLKLTLLAIPLWVAGLYFYLFARDGRRFRVLGWMYVLALALFTIAKGRGYYMIGAYPMLYAGGAVWGEGWVASAMRGWRIAARALAWTALGLNIVGFSALFLPLAPINSNWWKAANKVQGDFRDEIGWQELVQSVVQVRDSLPAEDRARLGILVGNYGEAGAINLYGPAYGLPTAISGINSFWQRGYGDPPPETLIVLGLSRRFVSQNFSSCELVARTWNAYGIENEETEYAGIFVCRGLRQPWPEFWKDFRYYG